MNTQATRSIFFISDGTGITAETFGHSLLAQFPNQSFRQIRVPFVDDLDKAIDCSRQINAAHKRDGIRPIVFSSLVKHDTVQQLHQANALFIDLFGQFIGPLEEELGTPSAHTVGRFHGIAESQEYLRRIDAINFAMGHDDGLSTNEGLENAEVVLVGVSRSAKTPTSLYLAMQFGVKAANYPLIPEDFERNKLPGELHLFRRKLFGLSIAPERLMQIRQQRRPNSRYASLENCRYEIEAAQKLMRREAIPWLDSTTRSIEEIAAIILQKIAVTHSGY